MRRKTLVFVAILLTFALTGCEWITVRDYSEDEHPINPYAHSYALVYHEGFSYLSTAGVEIRQVKRFRDATNSALAIMDRFGLSQPPYSDDVILFTLDGILYIVEPPDPIETMLKADAAKMTKNDPYHPFLYQCYNNPLHYHRESQYVKYIGCRICALNNNEVGMRYLGNDNISTSDCGKKD